MFFVGENGSGKSTLLEAIAIASGFNAEGGGRNNVFSTRPPSDDGEPETDGITELAGALMLSRSARHRDGFFLRAESFFNVASHLDGLENGLGPYGGISLHRRSHGESFLTLFLKRFGGGGLYLLDEPEAALSPARQLALMTRIHDLLAADSRTQFIIASHSPIILAFPNAQILSFDGGTIHEIAYTATDAYVITRRFLEAPSRMMAEMFGQPPANGGILRE